MELLLIVKEMAHQRKTTAGHVVSSILRDSFQAKELKWEYKNGVPLLPRRPNGPGWQAVTGCSSSDLEVLPVI